MCFLYVYFKFVNETVERLYLQMLTCANLYKPLNEHFFFSCTRMYAYNSCMCKSVVFYGAQVIFQKHLFNDWIESTCPP